MSPLAYILRNNGILNTTINEVDIFLSSNVGNTYSTSEIFQNLSPTLKKKLLTIASYYKKGACTSPASYVGVVAAMLAKQNHSFFHNYRYFCPILKRFDDAFKKK